MADVKKQAASRLQKKAEKCFDAADFDEALRLVNKAIKISPSPEAQALKVQINGEISTFGSWQVEAPEAEEEIPEPVILLPASPTSRANPKQPTTPNFASHKYSTPSFEDDDDDANGIDGLPTLSDGLTIDDSSESKSESKSSTQAKGSRTPNAKSYPPAAEAKKSSSSRAVAGFKAESKASTGAKSTAPSYKSTSSRGYKQ